MENKLLTYEWGFTIGKALAIFLSLGGVYMNISLNFVFVMMERYDISKFVNFEGDSGFCSGVKQI